MSDADEADPDVDVSWEFSAAAQTPRAPVRRAGDVIAERFRLDAWLGAGAYGVVYRAEDLELGRSVALKLWRGDPDGRFTREAELTAGLDHPGIVRIHQVGTDQGQSYLVYELVEEAVTLLDVLPEADRAERLRLLGEVASAVAYAHAQGVVHRDLKPSNVLVGGDGRVRVADFGLAWQAGALDLTRSGAAVGTPRYMAPEQLRGGAAARDPRVDVWALGVMLYHALVDGFPYVAANPQALRAALAGPPPAWPRALDPTVEPALDAVCQIALERSPSKRFDDAAAFAAALTRAQAGEAPVRPRGWASGVSALLVLAVVLGAIWVGWPAAEAPGLGGWADAQELADAGQLERALAATRRYRAARPREPQALAGEVAVLLTLARVDEAAELLAAEGRQLPPPVSAALGARLAARRGVDPRPALTAAIGRWPSAAAPRLELARYVLRAFADDLTAADVLTPLREQPEAGALLAAVPDLLGTPAPSGRANREALAGAALVLGRREAGLARWADDPRCRADDGGEPGAERWARARAAFQRALELSVDPSVRTQAWLGLAAGLPPGDPARAHLIARSLAGAPRRAHRLRASDRLARGDAAGALADLDEAGEPPESRLRGAAYLALGRAEDAVTALQAAVVDQADACDLLARAHAALGRPAEAAAARERADRLRGSRRAEARARFFAMRARKPSRETQAELCGELLELDPLLQEAQFIRSRMLAVEQPATGLRETIQAVARCPALLAAFCRMAYAMHTAGRTDLLRAVSLLELAEQSGLGDSTLDRLVRATALLVAVEYQGRRDLIDSGRADLEAVLAIDPGQPLAWILRGILELRAGRLDRAARDLGVARGALGDDPTILFHEAVLGAQRGAPAAEVRDLLERADRAGYELWGEDGWSPELYPGLSAYAGQLGFEMLTPR